jgi:hypothetical protein
MAVVVDNLFCESYFKALRKTVLDPAQWNWETPSSVASRTNYAQLGVERQAKREHGQRTLSRKSTVNPHMLGHAFDMRKERQLRKDTRTCLLNSLPPHLFDELMHSLLLGGFLAASIPDAAKWMPTHVDSPATAPIEMHYRLTQKSHSLRQLIPTEGFATVAHTKPKDISIRQGTHVDIGDHLASVYTITDDRRIEAAGTAFHQQKGTGLYKIQSASDVVRFYQQKEDLHKQALINGEPEQTGYLNSSESRFGRTTVVIPNRANRIALYYAGIPHCAWIPSEGILSETFLDGRLTYNTFYRLVHVSEKRRRTFCLESVHGINIDEPQGLAEACDKCSKNRDCAWYPSSKQCAPAACVFGDFTETDENYRYATAIFSCDESIGVHSANGRCAIM